jgi:predicted LPLAT superfamily acyltransferase
LPKVIHPLLAMMMETRTTGTRRMSTWEGTTRGGVTGYNIFIFLLKHCDLRVAYVVLRFVAFYFLFVSPKAFASIYRFYRRRLVYGPAKSLWYVYRNFYSLGQSLLDKIALLAGFEHEFTFDFEDEIHIRKLIEEGRGGILVGAHLGSWEISGQFLNRLKGTYNIVLLDSEHEKIKDLLATVEVKKTLRVIAIREDLSHIFEINNALLNKEFICIHGDRFMPGSKSVEGTLFGGKAKFPYGVFFLAVK